MRDEEESRRCDFCMEEIPDDHQRWTVVPCVENSTGDDPDMDLCYDCFHYKLNKL